MILGRFTISQKTKRETFEKLTRWSSRFRTRVTLNVTALGIARLGCTYERYIERIGRHVDVGPLLAPLVISARTLLQCVRLNRVGFSAGRVIDLISHPGVLFLLSGHQIPNRRARIGRIGLTRVHRAPHRGAECKGHYRIWSRRDYASGSD